MPYGQILRKPDARHSECVLAIGYDGLRVYQDPVLTKLVMILGRAGAIE